MYEDMKDIMKHKGPDDPMVRSVPNPEFSQSEMVKQMTGLNINPEELQSTTEVKKQEEYFIAQTPTNPFLANLTDDVDVHSITVEGRNPRINQPVQIPSQTPHQTPLTPDDIAELENSGIAVKVDPDRELLERDLKRVDAAQTSAKQSMFDGLDNLLKEEEKRLQEADEQLSDPEKVKELYTNPDSDVDGMSVTYDRMAVTTESKKSLMDDKKEFNPIEAGRGDDDDLTPAYDYEEEKEPSAEETVTPDPGDDEAYAEYVRQLEVSTVSEEKSVVSVLKDRRINTITVDSGRNKPGKYVGDQSFMNTINKFKKDNFPTVSVPLPNSGFIIDIVGTGVVDLIQLYTRVSEETTGLEYTIEKMRTTIKNVVGSHPKIDPAKLKDLIHYNDYAMMAYGHICATLDTVEIVTNCTECGKPFRITANPKSLAINIDALYSRMTAIQNANNIEQYSLLTTNREVVTKNGFRITLGHPSYGEYIKVMNQIKEYSTQMKSSTEVARFVDMAEIFNYVRSIKLPDGVSTSTIYQVYLALNMLSDIDFTTVKNEIAKMKKDILEPEFGIATVTCPHCKSVNTNLRYEGLDELIFFHSTVSRWLAGATTEKP